VSTWFFPTPPPAGLSIPPTLPFVDTIVSLSFLAASTSTITLASGIIVPPLRNAVVRLGDIDLAPEQAFDLLRDHERDEEPLEEATLVSGKSSV
jgi:hypothetical protein